MPLDTETQDPLLTLMPDKTVSIRETFGVDSDMQLPAFSTKDQHVPDFDPAYKFDPQTTLAICAGFAHDRRVMIQGYHGTGKSTHIEQVAARLNWPLIRVNLDSHVSRIDLVGKDAIVLKDGKQITEFREGMLPWAIQRPIALADSLRQDHRQPTDKARLQLRELVEHESDAGFWRQSLASDQDHARDIHRVVDRKFAEVVVLG